jgi:alkylmercury lyase
VVRTESDRLESLASAVAKAAPEFDEEQQNIALAVYRQLAEGSPASAAAIAARAGASVQRVQELVGSWPGVFLDGDQRGVGFWGLTIHKLSPTHSLHLDGREPFAWCAWDTLFLPGLLHTGLDVRSVCPTTGETISLVVSPSAVVTTSHPDAVVSFRLPDRDFDADVIQGFCHFVHFFTSAAAGEAWTAQQPGTFLLSLNDAFELGRRVNALNYPSFFGDGR